MSVTTPKREDLNVNQLLTVEILKQFPEVFGTQLGSFPGNREFKFDFQYQYRYQCFHFRSHFGTGNFKALSYHDR